MGGHEPADINGTFRALYKPLAQDKFLLSGNHPGNLMR